MSSRKPWSSRLMIVAGLTACLTSPIVAQEDADGDLKKINDVLREAVEAMGGRDAVDRVQSIAIRAEMEGGGMSLTTETYWSKDGGRMIKRKVPGSPEIVMGSDGKVGWRSNPVSGQYELLGGDMLEEFNNANMHIAMLQLDRATRKKFRSMKTVGRETFQDRDCWKVRVINKDGETEFFYFDAATRLPYGAVMKDDSGKDATLILGTWRPVGDLVLFHHATLAGAEQMMTFDFVEITVNELEDDFFAAPPEVKELAAASAERAAAARPKLEDFSDEQQQKITSILTGLRNMQNIEQLRNAVRGMEMAANMVPPDERPMFEYVSHEAKKILAEREGG